MKTTNSSNKNIYVIAGGVLLIIAGYFGFKWWQNRQTQTAPPPPPPPPSSAKPPSSAYTSNPFDNKAKLLAFQQWVINTKKDNTILGSEQADGFWGRKSATAWDKYGKEYLTKTLPSETSATPLSDTAEKDIATIISNCSGNYCSRDHLIKLHKTSSSLISLWANAVRKRLELKPTPTNPKGGTTFIWNGKIYDSYRGVMLSPKVLVGKTAYKYIKNVNAYIYPNFASSKTNVDSYPKEVGLVKGMYYNVHNNRLFLYIPADSYVYKWYDSVNIEQYL